MFYKNTTKRTEMKIKTHVLPGGRLPQRQTKGAIGFDVYLRAVVSADEMSTENPLLRRTLFDFMSISDDPHIVQTTERKLVWRMEPGESVLVGIGFTAEMHFPTFYWVAPRSGLASKYGITVTNAPGTVDPDYRGEAGVLVYNRSGETFDLTHNMRIAQIIFQQALIPELQITQDPNEFETSERGTGGFGSTGIR